MNPLTCRSSYCTVFPDDALCGGVGSLAICHSQSVHAAVRCGVSINLECRLLLLGAHTDIWPRTSTLETPARARGQCHSLNIKPRFRLVFPGYCGDVFQVSTLDLGFQIQAGSGDYIHRLFIEDVH